MKRTLGILIKFSLKNRGTSKHFLLPDWFDKSVNNNTDYKTYKRGGGGMQK